jgi:hypothetical protein
MPTAKLPKGAMKKLLMLLVLIGIAIAVARVVNVETDAHA